MNKKELDQKIEELGIESCTQEEWDSVEDESIEGDVHHDEE